MTPERPATFGWVRDLPDPRDYVPDRAEVRALYRELEPLPPGRSKRADCSEYFLPAADQLGLHASPAHACAGLADYFERRSTGSATESSRLFLYQTARRMARAAGAPGADLRTTLKTMARFGLPPERHWPFDLARVDHEPEPFVYAYARDLKSLCYVRLDPVGATGERVLLTVKGHVAAGLPSAFGFSAFDTLSLDPDILPPTRFDSVRGGGAAVVVGYDDTRRIRSAKGALRVRAPWGEGWGEAGYGWLPYAYVEEHLAVDFWTILRPEWLASGEFRRPP